MAEQISSPADSNSVNKHRSICSVPERAKLHLAMLVLQFGYAGFHVVSRAALNMGINMVVFVVYRNIIALLLLAPFAFFFEKKERPTMKISFLIQFFLLALIGIGGNQGFYLLGLDHTSPTFVSAMQNSVPAITCLLAAALRIEPVKMNRKDGVAKVMGTLVCVAGASVITLFKGPTIYGGPSLLHRQSPLAGYMHDEHNDEVLLGQANGKNWTVGCAYIIAHCLCWSAWLVLQAPVLKKYPAGLSVTSFTCFFGVLQFLAIAAILEWDSNAWVLESGEEILMILYAGFVPSGLAFAVQIWCIDRGGPVFVAVYQPVQTLVVAAVATVAMGEEFYLGGVIGAIMIIIGLYFVLWGKNEEKKFVSKINGSITGGNFANNHVSNINGGANSALAEPLLLPYFQDSSV